MIDKLGDEDIKPLKAGYGAHKIAVVKGEHNRIAALGVKNIGQPLLHTPVKISGAFDMKIACGGKFLV
ncbi:hypothetical protein FACS1894124_2770 [Spirochaetia bacterium]|nr:hypothetical protein FACS1894124_2770 [Spirochaetia bacterium]